MKHRRICIFCGSKQGLNPGYASAAKAIAESLARRQIGIVYGGGNVGLMGVVADAALAMGGEVIGVIPEVLLSREVAHEGLSRLHVVESMHERKALMADLSQGFIALPGGYGTLEEFCEVLTWAQLGIHSKPCGLLNVNGYFDRMLDFIDHAIDEQFIPPEYRQFVLQAGDPVELIELMECYRPVAVQQWISRAQR